jgi:hypothetical protein
MGKEKYENLGCAGKSGFESGDQTVKLINRGDIFVDTKRAHKGYSIKAITNSPITGNKGTRELFIHMSLLNDSSVSDSTLKGQIELSIKRAMDLDKYKK